MKIKNYKQRLEILKDYKKSIVKFLGVSIFAGLLLCSFFLVIMDNPFNLTALPFLSIIVPWIILFFVLLFKTHNKNVLLSMASLLMWVYVATFNEVVMNVIWFLVAASFFYEVIMRFALGIEFKIVPKELPWNKNKEKKK